MDESERPVANGVYFYLLSIGDKSVTKRMVLIDWSKGWSKGRLVVGVGGRPDRGIRMSTLFRFPSVLFKNWRVTWGSSSELHFVVTTRPYGDCVVLG